jgi:dTDP-4-amino-4,6-dideoxygalactose transaminase
VFVDIELETFNIDPKAVEAAITKKTRAIQVVHLYGHPANMEKILAIAEKHNLLVIEDAAQAHGAQILGQNVGSFGDAAAFSFYPTKNMTSGEGGMVVTLDENVERLARLLRNQGMEKRYANEVVGFNLRMTDIHAAIGRVQLRKLHRANLLRRENAKYLSENLEGVVVPVEEFGYTHVYHQYTIRVVDHDRDRFAQELEKLGVGSGVYYPTPVHKLPSFNKDFDLKKTKTACKQVLSLPVHPKLSMRDLHKIVKAVNQVAKAGS